MLFNSYAFVFFFLPVCWLVYATMRTWEFTRLSIAWLVLCSFGFYGWWNPSFLSVFVGSVFFNYLASYTLACSRSLWMRRMVLYSSIGLNILMLAYFKYTMFGVATFNDVFGTSFSVGQILLPIGISFFTFQQIAFLVDSYQGKSGVPKLLDYCLFVAFFPQLIAGPIVHHKQMMPQFSDSVGSRKLASDLAVGVTIFAIGLFKKVMIADEMAMHASPVFDAAHVGTQPTITEAWIAALSYTMQLYFDFSGYSDMAIGIARMFGILLPLNFNSPYKATSIVEFWRSWHITLSQFLRDYLYIPLGGSRGGDFLRYRNLMITMLLGGLWHGAGWTFVVWGGLHGAYLVVNHWWSGNRLGKHLRDSMNPYMYRMSSWVVTFGAVVFAWVLFRAASWDAAMRMVTAMLGMHGLELSSSVSRLHAAVWIPSLLASVLMLPNTQEVMRRCQPVYEFDASACKPMISWIRWRPSFQGAIAIGFLLFFSVLNLNRVSEFVYYQF
jgi:alginate O-acetyltransferase complex protein AlgI